MLTFAHGSGTHQPLDFSTSRSRDYFGVSVERKICEGFCGGTVFMRQVPKSAREGVKLCAGCTVKAAQWKAREEARRQRFVR